jgi:hypothetical protein
MFAFDLRPSLLWQSSLIEGWGLLHNERISDFRTVIGRDRRRRSVEFKMVRGCIEEDRQLLDSVAQSFDRQVPKPWLDDSTDDPAEVIERLYPIGLHPATHVEHVRTWADVSDTASQVEGLQQDQAKQRRGRCGMGREEIGLPFKHIHRFKIE